MGGEGDGVKPWRARDEISPASARFSEILSVLSLFHEGVSCGASA